MEADLVLEGGGVKGIGLVGAVSLLTEKGYRFHRVGGTSAGAVVGSLVAAGISTVRLEEVMREVDYTRFQDASVLARVPLVGPFLSLALEDGIYEGNYLKRWLGAHLAELGVRTFGDLRLDADPETSLPRRAPLPPRGHDRRRLPGPPRPPAVGLPAPLRPRP